MRVFKVGLLELQIRRYSGAKALSSIAARTPATAVALKLITAKKPSAATQKARAMHILLRLGAAAAAPSRRSICIALAFWVAADGFLAVMSLSATAVAGVLAAIDDKALAPE